VKDLYFLILLTPTAALLLLPFYPPRGLAFCSVPAWPWWRDWRSRRKRGSRTCSGSWRSCACTRQWQVLFFRQQAWWLRVRRWLKWQAGSRWRARGHAHSASRTRSCCWPQRLALRGLRKAPWSHGEFLVVGILPLLFRRRW